MPNNKSSENDDLASQQIIKTALLDSYLALQTHVSIVSVIIMTLFSAVLWNNFNNNIILIWLMCGYVIAVIRAAVHPWIKHNIKPSKQYRYNKIAVLVIVALSSSLWGSTAWLFLDMTQPEIFIFVIVTICIMCVAAIATHSAYLPAVWIFLINTLGMLSLKLFTIGSFSLSALTLLLCFTTIILTRGLQSTVQKSVILDLHNQELLKEATAAKELAESSSLAKSRFLATASHDLRQPLHAIALLINLLKTKNKNLELTQIVESMEVSTDAMMTLFDNILDVSRLDGGITTAHTVPTDLHIIINRLTAQFKNQAENKGLNFNFEDNIPPETPCLVMADKVHLERCLNNIVNNSIKFTQLGGININLVDTGTTVQVSISDSGEGIAEKDIEHIFDEFSQVTSSNRAQGQGLGLGLSIVKRLTELMHIKLKVTSTLGQGSCFSLTINKAEKGASVPVVQPITTKNEIQMSGLTVLIVDDDEAVRKSLQQLLESWECTVHTANDLAQAEAAVKQAKKIDALLIDYGLRDGVTGLDVINHLFTSLLPHKPPVLIITGDTSTQSMVALNASGFAFLHKPAKPNKIRNFLQRSGKSKN